MIDSFTTRQGCKVRVERAGDGVGITITQADGKSMFLGNQLK